MQVYILDGQEQLGPFTADELRQKVENGEFDATTLAWHEGLLDWTPLVDMLPSQDGSERAHVESRLQPVANPPPLPRHETTAQDRAWYHYGLVIFPAAIFCFPIGLLPLWLTKRFHTKRKIGLIVAFGAGMLICFILFVVLLRSTHNEDGRVPC
jgi:hypothetical protein